MATFSIRVTTSSSIICSVMSPKKSDEDSNTDSSSSSGQDSTQFTNTSGVESAIELDDSQNDAEEPTVESCQLKDFVFYDRDMKMADPSKYSVEFKNSSIFFFFDFFVGKIEYGGNTIWDRKDYRNVAFVASLGVYPFSNCFDLECQEDLVLEFQYPFTYFPSLQEPDDESTDDESAYDYSSDDEE